MSEFRPGIMRLEYRDQKLVPCRGICPECNQPYEKMLLASQAKTNKLCGKDACKVSSQRKRSAKNKAKRKLKVLT